MTQGSPSVTLPIVILLKLELTRVQSLSLRLLGVKLSILGISISKLPRENTGLIIRNTHGQTNVWLRHCKGANKHYFQQKSSCSEQKFTPKDQIFYTDNNYASVINSMSVHKTEKIQLGKYKIPHSKKCK